MCSYSRRIPGILTHPRLPKSFFFQSRIRRHLKYFTMSDEIHFWLDPFAMSGEVRRPSIHHSFQSISHFSIFVLCIAFLSFSNAFLVCWHWHRHWHCNMRISRANWMGKSIANCDACCACFFIFV